MTYSQNVVTGDKYRVDIIADEDAQLQEGDYLPPTLRIAPYSVSALNDADEFVAAYEHFNEYTMNPLDAFERYVRIFHGSTSFESYNVGSWRENGYVAFDTAEWRERVGVSENPGNLLTEVKAWVEGDVWGVAVYEAKVWTGADADDTMTTWEEVDAVWGYYGQSYAEQEARDQYAAYTE